ncbi:MAG: tetratricopeptide repeat protein [Gemmatimonadota bacterium]|nr:tetratricopeptide repeat protein [Gemmatimonadota bacterium]
MKIHPSTLLAWKWFGGIVILAIFLPITVANTLELLTASAPPETNNAGTIHKDSATTPIAVVPDSAAITVEMQRRFNELRREILDDRARVVDWWLVAIGIVLTFFGIVVAIVGILGFRRFREIENEAKNSIQIVTDLEKSAKRNLEEIEETRERSLEIVQRMNAELVADDPEGVGQAVKSVQNDPNASLIDKAVAHAVFLQRQGKRNDAIENWRAIAHVADDADNFLAARAWFSVGYLLSKEHTEDRILAYDNAIRLKPDFVQAYNNRGNAKRALGKHEEAIADYNRAIALRKNYAQAYNNRGNAKRAMGKHEEAIADYDQAIAIRQEYSLAHNNRGKAKHALGRVKEARTDFDTALEQARNVGNAKLAARAEKSLRDLDNVDGSS